jgi:sugar/nucleoside kinase (ribokinase family)
MRQESDLKRFDVTLAGEITMDFVMYGLPEELPVERELLAPGMALTLGGSSAITAHNLAALGSKTGFIPQLADDPFTELCLRGLRETGVDLERAVASKKGIGTGVSVLLQHETVRRTLTYSGTISSLRYEDLDLAYLASGRHFHLSSFFLQSGLRDDVPKLLANMRKAGLTTSMDTNDDPEDTWQGPIAETLRELDILMPNEREACRLAGEPDLESALCKLAKIVPTVVVKCGAAGALVMHHGERYCMPGAETKVIDLIGAGDSFNAGFLHTFVHGGEIDECLRMGNLCGAYSTTAHGGTEAFRNREQMSHFMEQYSIIRPVRLDSRDTRTVH